MKRSVLLTFLLVLVGFYGVCQFHEMPTRLSITKQQLRGYSVGAGAMWGGFFNPTFQNNLADNITKSQAGLTIELRYTAYPFHINANLFGANYQLQKFQGKPSTDGITARHTGGEVGLALALFHSSKSISPYIGAGYQKAVLGTGIKWLGKKDEDNAHLLSVTDVSMPVFKFGLDLRLKQLGGRIEYRRGFDAKRGFNLLSFLISSNPMRKNQL